MNNENFCTDCNGHGEIDTTGSYADFEPPTRKCFSCRGTGDREVQEYEQENWRVSVAFVMAKNKLK